MKNQIEIYTTRDNEIAVEVRFDQETVWLNRNRLSLLFDRDIKTIGKHVNNVFRLCQKFYEKNCIHLKEKKREIIIWLDLELRKGSAQARQ